MRSACTPASRLLKASPKGEGFTPRGETLRLHSQALNSQVVNVAELVVGIAILYWGAEWLIRGSAAVARAFGVKPLVVGLTVVAYGTSAPELAVATKTALAHHQPIALGTVIGSCAANISLILGLTALIAPPTVDGRIIRREVPVLLGSAVAVPILFRNGVLSHVEGYLLIACAIVFTIVTLTVSARLEPDEIGAADLAPTAARAEASGAIGGRARPATTRGLAVVVTLFGLALLLVGSNLFVSGGRGLAGAIGMSERMLGLTVISIGTSLPELIGSVIAASRGHTALAVGSVIGSNLLNVFLVLGVTASLREIRLGERMHLVDLVGLVAITLLGVLMLRGSRRISRFEGAILVAAYVGFVVSAAVL
jgi:cation:H+ antiporter